jgi:hypothetical protein
LNIDEKNVAIRRYSSVTVTYISKLLNVIVSIDCATDVSSSADIEDTMLVVSTAKTNWLERAGKMILRAGLSIT